MRKLFVILLAACLLTGCSSKKAGQPTKAHTVTMDTLSLTVPEAFTAVNPDSGEQQFMFTQGNMFLYGYKENKQTLITYLKCDIITLDSYVESFTANNNFETIPQLIGNYWLVEYTDTIDGVAYTFMCAIYESENDFWRVYSCCPTETYQQNQAYLKNIITSAK